MRPAQNKPGYVQVNEMKIKAFFYEVALKEALFLAHHFAIENNIPYYRVEGKRQ